MSSADVDQLSLFILSAGKPAFILWIVCSFINIASVVLSIYVITSMKFMTGALRKTIVLHLVLEAIFSIQMTALASYHLYQNSKDVPETMKPFQCFKYVSSILATTQLSYWLMFVGSLDRATAIFWPNFYKQGLHTKYVKWSIIILSICQLLEIGAYHFDKFSDDLIPVCLTRSSMAVLSLKLYTYLTAISTISPPVIYFTSFLYLVAKYFNRSIENVAGLSTIKKQLKNRITWALIFMAVWQLMTISSASIYGLFTYGTKYGLNVLVGPYAACLFMTNGVAYVVCNCIYVKKFRTAMVKLILLRNLNSVADSTL